MKYFEKDDGYYDKNGVLYQSLEDFYQSGFFGFCGCGSPDENVRYIRDGLAHINKNKPDDMDYVTWCANWNKEGINIFGNEQSRYFFFYWCDKEGLTEHGSSVLSGWLTDKGKEVLTKLSQLEKT